MHDPIKDLIKRHAALHDQTLEHSDLDTYLKGFGNVYPHIAAAEIKAEGHRKGTFICGECNEMITVRPSFFDDVAEFHALFHLPLGEKLAFTSSEDQLLRMRLIREEVAEIFEAHARQDIVEVADGIADLIYVACGMAVSYGIPLNKVWAEVQRTNMAKAGPDGVPRYREDGKVLKPDGWTPPDIKSILERRANER